MLLSIESFFKKHIATCRILHFLIGIFLLTLFSFHSVFAASSIPQDINITTVRHTWLGWYNDIRAKTHLPPFTYSGLLNKTAFAWSETAKKRGSITHKRDGQTNYYDYQLIKKWFVVQGVGFKGDGTNFTENIGWAPYDCTKKDCTQDMIEAIRPTFDFYIGEKDKKYRPHYDSIMSSDWKKIGLGISVDPVKKRLYLTVHYAKMPRYN